MIKIRFSLNPKPIMQIPTTPREIHNALSISFFMPLAPSMTLVTSIPEAQRVSTMPKVFLLSKSRIIGSDKIYTAPMQNVIRAAMTTKVSRPLLQATAFHPFFRSSAKEASFLSFFLPIPCRTTAVVTTVKINRNNLLLHIQ